MQPHKSTPGPLNQPNRISYGKPQHRSLLTRVRQHLFHKSLKFIPSSNPYLTVAGSSPDSPEKASKMTDSGGSTPTGAQSSSSFNDEDYDPQGMDGSGEKRTNIWGRQHHPPVGAIFVHAGAGYHSTTNEHIHLGACADAAKMAMRVLRSGGSAVEAVEAAIRVLEDKEITNAGYGSNLTIEGIVECDATVVDHLGRSGACGAVAKIKNPIHLARIILEQSSRPLSLRRVPPNLLIADGAAEFGWEHGIDIVPHDSLVSKNARDRFVRWREDLRRAGGGRAPGTPNSTGSNNDEVIDHEFEEKLRAKQRRDHYNALLTGTWNEGQPDSPMAGSTSSSPAPQDGREPPYFPEQGGSGPPSIKSKNSRSGSPIHSRSSVKRPRYNESHQSSDGGYTTRIHSLLGPKGGDSGVSTGEVQKTMSDPQLANFVTKHGQDRGSGDGSADDSPSDYFESSTTIPASIKQKDKLLPPYMLPGIDEDLITDTVGAIAIDMFGNIAAGSSSGGIGMKHRGRVGPAALVGVGTAVIPVNFEDTDNVCVAAVTSGTGEHMATTMASQKCSERLYFNTRRGRGGTNAPATEEEAMESFVINDFMDHPGVKNSHSAGAIGVMAVKKGPGGYFLHFAHNTDSFALASMHSGEKEPKCVMSRLGDYGSVVQGGRKIRLE